MTSALQQVIALIEKQNTTQNPALEAHVHAGNGEPTVFVMKNMYSQMVFVGDAQGKLQLKEETDTVT